VVFYVLENSLNSTERALRGLCSS